MKLSALFFAVVVFLTGCMRDKTDERVVGNFVADNHDMLTFESNGDILFARAGMEPVKGSTTIDKEEPLTLHVIGPAASSLVGTKFTFSSGRRRLNVEWPTWKNPDAPLHSVEFRKQ